MQSRQGAAWPWRIPRAASRRARPRFGPHAWPARWLPIFPQTVGLPYARRRPPAGRRDQSSLGQDCGGGGKAVSPPVRLDLDLAHGSNILPTYLTRGEDCQAMAERSRYLSAQTRADLATRIVFVAGPRQVGKTTFAQALPGRARRLPQPGHRGRPRAESSGGRCRWDAQVRPLRGEAAREPLLVSSSDTGGTMLTGSPGVQSAGVATAWAAVSCSESMTRSSSRRSDRRAVIRAAHSRPPLAGRAQRWAVPPECSWSEESP